MQKFFTFISNVLAFALLSSSNYAHSHDKASESDEHTSKIIAIISDYSFKNIIKLENEWVGITFNNEIMLGHAVDGVNSTNDFLKKENIKFERIDLSDKGETFRALAVACSNNSDGYCLITGQNNKFEYAMFKLNILNKKANLISYGAFSKYYYLGNEKFYALDYNARKLAIVDVIKNEIYDTNFAFPPNSGLIYSALHGSENFNLVPIKFDYTNNKIEYYSPEIEKGINVSVPFFGVYGMTTNWGDYISQKVHNKPDSKHSKNSVYVGSFFLNKDSETSASFKLHGATFTAPDNIFLDEMSVSVSKTGRTFAVIGTDNGVAPSILCKNKVGDSVFKPIIFPQKGYRVDISNNQTNNDIIISYSNSAKASRYLIYKESFPKFPENVSCNSVATFDFPFKTDEIKIINARNSRAQLYYVNEKVDKKERFKGAIIDIYGAYGVQSGKKFTPWSVPPDDILIAWAALRGDGDFGYKFANDGFSPNRINAVNDINELSEELINKYPELKGKIVLRGFSAGAWLAVRAAIERPDIYKGVIAGAGGYKIKAINDYQKLSPYLTPIDDDLYEKLKNIPDGCAGLRFILLHGKADSVVSPNQTIELFEFLKKKNCGVKSEILEGFGHELRTDFPTEKNFQDDLLKRNSFLSSFPD